MASLEHLNWHVVASVAKWDFETLDRLGLLNEQADALRSEGVQPYADGIWDRGNILCNAGINRMLNLLIGGGGQAFNNANTRLGTGNGSSAAAATDTDLSAAAGANNRYFCVADATYPSVSAQTLTLQSTFTNANGNYQWTEWGIDNGTVSGTTVVAPLLNHKIPSPNLGTKTSGSWALTVTLTIS